MVIPTESRLSRFLKQSNHFNSNGRVTYKAFMPPPDLQFSVYHTDDLDPEAMILLATDHVLNEVPPGRSIYGHADLRAADYIGQGLTVDRDDDPMRHTTIANWAAGDDPTAKEARKEVALELAELAVLSLFTPSLTRA